MDQREWAHFEEQQEAHKENVRQEAEFQRKLKRRIEGVPNAKPSSINPAATAWLFAFILGGIAWANGGSVIAAGIMGLVLGYFIRKILVFAVIAFVIYALVQML